MTKHQTTENGRQEAAQGRALPQHSSESAEHFTPAEIVEAARGLMGGIDLDPASCELAQETVRAEVWYGTGSADGVDGFAEPWIGRVFLNPPGGVVPDAYKGMGTRSNAALWWGLLASAWQAGEVEAAVFVGFTLEILRSAQALDVPQPLDFPLCVPSSRVAFDTPNRVIETGKRAGELIDPGAPVGARVGQSSPAHANVIVWLPPVDIDHRDERDTFRLHVKAPRHVDPFVDLFSAFGKVRA